MSTYEPGTVAVATVRGVPNVRVFRSDSPLYPWLTAESVDMDEAFSEGEVDDVRLLVVLDLDLNAHIGVRQLVTDLRREKYYDLADQIDAQTKPPRIPEPGLWGVVEAGWDSRGESGLPRAEWMRVKGNLWHSTIAGVSVAWDELIDPVLIRDGVEDAS